MSQLRAAGVVLSSRPLMIDVKALDQPADDCVSAEPARAALVGLLARHAELVGQAAQLLADMTAIQAEIARAVAPTDTRESAIEGSAELAEVRDIKAGRKVDLPHLPCLTPQSSAVRDSRTSRTVCTPLEDVDRLVEPLRVFCRSTGRPDHLDDRGRRILARLDPAALAAGVTTIQREATTNPRVTRPIGLLIDRACKNDAATFAAANGPSPDAKLAPRPGCPGCHGTGLRLVTDPGTGEVIAGTELQCPCRT